MRLKDLRKSRGLSQEKLAEELELARTTYNHYEINKSEPNIETLIKLADYFDVSLDYLCERQWNNQIGYVADDRREDMIKISELSDNEFKLVVAYVQALTDINKKNKY